MGYTIDDGGVVVISTRDDLNSSKYQIVRVYDIGVAFGPPSQYRVLISRILWTPSRPPWHQKSWRDAGGQIGSIRELDGRLIINQTRENHRAIVNLLRELSKAAMDRVHVYDVRDVVGNDDEKLVRLMDMLESLSSSSTWIDRNGYLAVMRGVNGHIFVTGPTRAQTEVAYLLKLIRENKVEGGNFSVVKPMGLPHSAPPPPQTQPKDNSLLDGSGARR